MESKEEIRKLKKERNAIILAHVYQPGEVQGIADFIGSTAQMSRYVAQSDQKEFIVGTEDNFVYRLRKDNPDRKFYAVGTLCVGMNQINLEKVKLALEQMENEVYLPEEIRLRAKNALDKMSKI